MYKVENDPKCCARARQVKFQTDISPKRFKITLSIWYANSSGAQALSIGKGYGALAGHIRKIVGQNFLSAFGYKKGWKR